MTSIEKINFDGDSSLGLHAEATEDYCIVDPSLSGKCYDAIKRVLSVDPIKTPMVNSRMVGIFCASNSEGVTLPKNVGKSEKKVLEDRGIDFKVLDTKQTALGNLVLVNDEACLISEKLEDVKEDLSSFFDVPVQVGEIGALDLVGSVAVVTNSGLLCHRDTSEEEMELLEEFFGLECGRGTVNFGMPFVGSCIVANSKGVLVSEKTTGPELGRVQESLLE